MRYGYLAAALVLVVPVGCKSNEKVEPAMVSTPLALDPTHEVVLAEWWTNGDQLLHLGDDGAYALFEGINRYRDPQERGQWSRINYAAVRLEPYAELPTKPARVSLTRVGGDVVLNVRDLDPMFPLEGAPVVIEDRLIGRWRGTLGTLWLGADMRYRFSPQADMETPASIAAQQGAWSVEGAAILLRPDSLGQAPSRVRIAGGDEIVVLEMADGRLSRAGVVADG